MYNTNRANVSTYRTIGYSCIGLYESKCIKHYYSPRRGQTIL